MSSHNNNLDAPDINTGYPGHIYNFDAASQTCEVQLAIENLFVGYTSAYITPPKQRLQKVPVQFIQGGGWSLTHDIPDRTPCYVHFAQRGIDHWLFENKDSAGMVNGLPDVAFGQLFDINSAICTIGNQPITEAIQQFLTGGMEIRNADRSQRVTMLTGGTIEVKTGAATITVKKDDEIEIKVNTKATVISPEILLDGAVTVTKSLTVLGGMDVSGTLPGGGTSKFSGNFNLTGNFTQNGTYTLNGIVVNTHHHSNPEGGDVGPMKA